MRLGCLITLLFISHCINGQGLFNTSSIYVNGADIFIGGGLHNTGAINNAGALHVSEDWTSEGSYHGNGKVVLTGSVPQKISHNTRQVHTLIIDGPGPKYVKGTLNITRALHLRSGILMVSRSNALVVDEEASISGGSPESYVDGPMTVKGTGPKVFPVGRNGQYAPIAFTNVEGNNPQFSVEVFENAPPIVVDGAIVRHGLYWQRTDLSGNFAGSPVTVFPQHLSLANTDDIILISGLSWDEPFRPISFAPDHVKGSLTTSVSVVAPIILLGDTDKAWRGGDFYLPNALSPHANYEANKRITVFTTRLAAEDFHFQVFDRSGRIIFETTSLEAMMETGWDGRTIQGQMMMSGSYPYRLSARDKTGAAFQKTGVITIVH